MNDPLIRKELSADWIDLGIGEARSVRLAFERTFGYGFDVFANCGRDRLLEYHPPSGLKQLVSFLEERHKQPIIVTAGAKQGLCAAFSAVRRMGCRKLGLRSPYWSQLPGAISSEGLKPVTIGDQFNYTWDPRQPTVFDSFLIVSPGNPDSRVEDQKFIDKLRIARVPIIHDAAYASRTYTGLSMKACFDADVEIYSFSKMFGLSGLRAGYCVVRDPDLYAHMLDYVETKTVGVSSLSQAFILSVLKRGEQPVSSNRTLMNAFEDDAREQLKLAAAEFKRIEDRLKPYHFYLPGHMFGWFRNLGIGVDFEKAKIHVLDGKHFGQPGYVRINFAAGVDVCRQAVDTIIAQSA